MCREGGVWVLGGVIVGGSGFAYFNLVVEKYG